MFSTVSGRGREPVAHSRPTPDPSLPPYVKRLYLTVRRTVGLRCPQTSDWGKGAVTVEPGFVIDSLPSPPLLGPLWSGKPRAVV